MATIYLSSLTLQQLGSLTLDQLGSLLIQRPSDVGLFVAASEAFVAVRLQEVFTSVAASQVVEEAE